MNYFRDCCFCLDCHILQQLIQQLLAHTHFKAFAWSFFLRFFFPFCFSSSRLTWRVIHKHTHTQFWFVFKTHAVLAASTVCCNRCSKETERQCSCRLISVFPRSLNSSQFSRNKPCCICGIWVRLLLKGGACGVMKTALRLLWPILKIPAWALCRSVWKWVMALLMRLEATKREGQTQSPTPTHSSTTCRHTQTSMSVHWANMGK